MNTTKKKQTQIKNSTREHIAALNALYKGAW